MFDLWQSGQLLFWVFRLARSAFLRSAAELNAIAEGGTQKHLQSFKMPLFLSAAIQEKVETEEGGPEMEAHDVSAPYTSSNPLSSQPILS